jgi:hypothetical protein
MRGYATLALIVLLGATVATAQDFVRVNQLGYAPGDPKPARLLARGDRAGQPFRVVRSADGTTVFRGTVGASTGPWGQFPASHVLDLGRLRRPGWYRVMVGTARSRPFVIDEPAYAATAEALLGFFAVQRCGTSRAAPHRACHTLDGAHPEGGRADLTGGWHDAGDYTKFLTTAAYATHLLLLAEEIRPGLAGDRDGNGRSDLLDEARVGAAWCLRLGRAPGTYVHQVQDARDHRVGWRLPENDRLAGERPAFGGVGRNHLGRLAAALARAARAFAPSEPAWAESCRAAAEGAYAAAALAPEIGDGTSYVDVAWQDKMALGAAELYLTTGRGAYLADARRYADRAGPGWWCGWSTLNGLAHALLAPLHPPSLGFLEKDLIAFRRQSDAHPWGMAGTETWGTTAVVAGAGVEALLHERLSGRSDYAALAFAQRDFLFGTNPWGVCFAGGLGEVHPRDFHHQVARLANRGELPGALAEGPAPASVIAEQGITLADEDEYAEFQSERGVYHDDRRDYVTNEPTLTANATAILFLALLDARAAEGAPAADARRP